MRVVYTPFLHAKKGEFEAMEHASTAERRLMLPLFEIAPFTDKVHALVRYRDLAEPIAAYLRTTAAEIVDSYPQQPVMVDTARWTETEMTETGELAITYAIQALRDRGQPVVPVVGLVRWESEEYQLALKALPFKGEPTWALRLDTADMEDAADPEHFLERVKEVMQGLGVLPKNMGILMDFEDVSGHLVDTLEALADRVLRLLGPGGYQFYSLVGCSMPPSVDKAVKKHNTEGTVSRKEMLAWRRLRAAHRHLPLAFGDYGVRGPRSSDAPNPYTNGKIRYTIEDQFYIVRGEPRKKYDEQMHRLAAIVTASQHYLGPDFSWGDSEIYRRAVRENIGKKMFKLIGPGGTTDWIKYDTSHHMAWVHRELVAAEHALGAALVEVQIPAE
jgi:hypothetical protein